ncbi:MAG TPA: hypothetical protein VH593_12665, partial [Ktedonobacteraceae bacterium]|jgi:hypothetical protein
MQQAQRREQSEQMSWARALIFGIGFFFITAILIGQLPGIIYFKMTEANLAEFERTCAALAVVGIGGFIIVQVIVLLFDPKPLVPPAIFTGMGAILSVGGLALAIWSTVTGCTPANPLCNQYFPIADPNHRVWSLLGGQFLWFQANAIDLAMLGIGILAVGLAMIFYSVLALREQRNPDRRDLGATPAISAMIIGATLLLAIFLVLYQLFDISGLAAAMFPGHPFYGQRLLTLGATIILGAAIFLATAAVLLRLHYLMRPVRKNTMSTLYIVGAIGLAQTGVIALIAWAAVYPLLAWMHNWTFIGLNNYLTICALQSDIPGSCTFSQQAGYIVDAIITTNLLVLLFAAAVVWKSRRNLVVIASIMTIVILAGMTFMLHTAPDQIIVALTLSVGILVLATVLALVARREIAIIGENKLGCIGQWLVMGTCLFVYIGAFAFFSMPVFDNDTEQNIPFVPGLSVAAPNAATSTSATQTTLPAADGLIALTVMAILVLLQFYFLIRNRYKA